MTLTPERMIRDLRIALRMAKQKDLQPWEEWQLLLGYAAGYRMSHDERRAGVKKWPIKC